MGLLAANTSHSSHLFWPNDLPFGDAVRKFGQLITGHQQVTDAYLLGLAIHRKAKLATLDRRLEIVFKQFTGNVELIH
jgi:predicted nucleic acid-binding protein